MNCVFFKNTILIQARAGQYHSETALICTHFEQLGYFHIEAKRHILVQFVSANKPILMMAVELYILVIF